MKKLLIGVFTALAFSSGSSYGSIFTLDFEGATDRFSIRQHYRDHGIDFSNDAIASVSISSDLSDLSLSGNFVNQPSGKTAMIFSGDGITKMNVGSGFGTKFSLFYSSSSLATVNLYEGLDGTGNLLASLNLGSNHENHCTNALGAWCHWEKAEVAFAGKAHSVSFDGPKEYTFYDNITLNSVFEDPLQPPSNLHIVLEPPSNLHLTQNLPPVSQVPVPGAFWLMGSGLIGLFRARRNK